jgi:two-component system C4-dicarboxylate transport sensor histidine kinase DctB
MCFAGFLPSLAAHSGRARWRLGLRLLAALAVCVLAGWGAREAFLARQLDTLARQSRQHVEFYRTSLDSLLTRNESLPRIAAMEGRLRELLRAPADGRKVAAANDYLEEVKERAGLNAAFLMDRGGLTLAASNYRSPGSYVAHNYAYRPYFLAAMEGRLGVFYGVGATTGEPGYFLAAPIEEAGRETPGAIVVKISLEDFEAALARSGDPILLVDANGVVILASMPDFKYRFLTPLESGVLRQTGSSRQYGAQRLRPFDADLRVQDGPRRVRVALPGKPREEYVAVSARTGRLGWSIVLLSQTRQERQGALLAGAAAGLAAAFLLSLAIFHRLNAERYRERRQAEAALRQAHAGLEKRIAARTADLTATNAALEEKVAALKTTETVLREARDTAVQAGKLAVLGQMAAGISHEVNQPLTALLTFADNAVDMLGRGRVDEVRENLGLIRQMADRMAHIVGEIKNFARRPAADRSAVEVAGVVDQALMLVEARRKRAEACIDAHGIPGDVRALADPQRLEQLLVNLLLNALDAVSDTAERRVTVAAVRAGGQVRIVVGDSGAGIAAAVLPHLFEPFFTTKAAGQGLGLGLAISRMIATELGGRLDARNREAGGAEFTVTLEAA